MRRFLLLVTAVILTLPVTVPGAGTDSARRVDQVFAAYDKPGSPGCALGVIQDGNFVYRKGYGVASLELGVPLSPQSVVYLGSLSKQFTAASVVLAAEQGFLSLDDNVRKYIPEIPDYGHPITLRQMLHHTSGFADVLGLLEISGRNLEDLHPAAELIDVVARQKALNFNPGDEYLYSNTNYFLLGEVVKRATKKSLAEFAAENIFKPLGMAHTSFYDDHNVVVPGRVAAYKPGKGGAFLVNWSSNYDNVGGGGVMSSVDDLLLWDRNFYANKLGKGTLLREMQTRGVLSNGRQISYALGLIVSTYQGLPIIDHDGGLFGYRTDIIRFPEQKFSVVCLCNLSSANPDTLSRKVADIYLDKELKSTPTAKADPTAFAAKYFDARTHFLVSFTVASGNLVLQGTALKAIKANRFEDPNNGATVTFSDGVTKATVIYDNEVTFAGTRIADLNVADAALGAYAGVYKSSELDATYKLSVENESLTLRMNWNPAIKLVPIIQDEFDTGFGTIVFRRDRSGHVSGLSVFSGWNAWIRNETFERVK